MAHLTEWFGDYYAQNPIGSDGFYEKPNFKSRDFLKSFWLTSLSLWKKCKLRVMFSKLFLKEPTGSCFLMLSLPK
jgi:hypothetical protein